MIDSDYLYKLEQISRENIQKNSHNPTYAFEARIKRRATAVPNDRIKFDFSTAVAWRLKPSRAIAMSHGKLCRATRQ